MPAAKNCISLLLVFILAINIGHVQNSRILGLFPHPGLSHFKFFQPIMHGLADAGHEIVVISYFPETKSQRDNYRDLVLSRADEILTNSVDLEAFETSSIYDYYVSFFELHQWGVDFCKLILNSTALDTALKIHQQTPFDLVITETFNSDCMLGVAHLMNVPVVGVSSCSLMPWHYDRFGLPDTPSFIPSQFVGFSETMPFYERLVNWWITKTIKLMYRFFNQDNQLLEEKFGKKLPDVEELATQTSLVLVNQHFSLSGPKPLSPQVVEVGGLHIAKAKPLPADIQEILDNATEGVVYISWGSMIRADSLPDAKRHAIVEAIGQLKQTVLWKWENDSVPDKPPNLHIQKWLPQRDILCHPNVKVFLAHGGLMGLSEAAYCGVPTVVTPIYGDQFLNAAAYAHRGAGVVLPYEIIGSKDAILESIQVALQSSTYKNAKALSLAFTNRPVDPLDLAIRTIEYVIENKGTNFMRSKSVEMNFIIFYSLDVIGFLLLLGYVLLKLIYGFFKCISAIKGTVKVKTH